MSKSITAQSLTILDRSEAGELVECEAVIERGLATFYDVGTALLKIRDERLYRSTHDTFEDYCRGRWQMSRPQAYRLIEAAAIAENLSPIGDKPTHESQIRPLTGLEPEQQRTVWEQAVSESGGQPTAIHVEEVKKNLTQVIKERIAARNKAEQQAAAKTDDPPMSRKEFAELREEQRVNGERVHRVMNFVRAIETLSSPALPIAEVAREILDMDTPDKDWCGQASVAERHLTKLVEELSL